MPAPFFSIIVATHLRASLLERNLRSLLAQDIEPESFEILVVADAWSEADASVASRLLRPQDSYHKRTGAPGPALSRNLGLDLARGEWILFLDDDDQYRPHHLRQLAATIAGNSQGQIFFSDCEAITEDRSVDPPRPLEQHQIALITQNTAALWLKNFIPNHALAYRRSLLSSHRFDEHLDSLEDWDFLLGLLHQATPVPYTGGGAVMHKDYVNPGNRRGTQTQANNHRVVQDFLHIYRRWPAPDDSIRQQRQALLASVGMNLPMDWF
ncbi:MAG: hypothetical protein RIQ52_1862 [Pseudomonadota bacterium]